MPEQHLKFSLSPHVALARASFGRDEGFPGPGCCCDHRYFSAGPRVSVHDDAWLGRSAGKGPAHPPREALAARRRRANEAAHDDHSHSVALTAYGAEEARKRSKEVVFERNLVKPVDLDALPQVVGGRG